MSKTKVKAKDIMTKEVISVKEDTPIYEAVKLLRKNEITGMPVVKDDMTLVGVLTEKDVLRLLYAEEEEKRDTGRSARAGERRREAQQRGSHVRGQRHEDHAGQEETARMDQDPHAAEAPRGVRALRQQTAGETGQQTQAEHRRSPGRGRGSPLHRARAPIPETLRGAFPRYRAPAVPPRFRKERSLSLVRAEPM